MRRRGWLGLFIALGVAAGSSGCVTISPIAATGDFPVAAGVRADGSHTLENILARGNGKGPIIIGVKEDQPGLGYFDPASKTYTGFDVEIAELVAARLGFSRSQIQFVPVQTAVRESALENRSVDLVVASYSYTLPRAQQVSFAGPYFQTGEGLLVRSDESSVNGMSSLTSSNQVCSTAGSTSFKQITEMSSAKAVSHASFSECVDALRQHQLDGVFTDLAVLAGYAAQDPQHLRLIEVPNGGPPQLYGIGLPLGDTVLQKKIDSILVTAEKDGTWQAIFNATLAPSGIKPVIPKDGDWGAAS